MGVYLNLDVMPDQIDPKAWTLVYAETLKLLHGYPDPLIGLHRDHLQGARRIYYSENLEHQMDHPAEHHWEVVGDRGSWETGETFCLYRQLKRDSPFVKEDLSSACVTAKSILVEWIRSASGASNAVWNKWGNKTQGRPYHRVLLAVGMWIEYRFPGLAMVGGDIDAHQAKWAQDYIANTLGHRIDPPIRLQAAPLLEALLEHYPKTQALEHFDTLYLGEPEMKYTVFCRMAGKSVFHEWFLNQCAAYASVNCLGIQKLCIGWINTMGDIPSLCELMVHDPRGPQFNPVTFAGVLAATWLSVPPKERACFDIFRKPEGALDSVERQFGTFLLDTIDAGGRTNRIYREASQVLNQLRSAFPEHEAAIQTRYLQKTQSLRQMLQAATDPLKDLSQHVEGLQPDQHPRSLLFCDAAESLTPSQGEILQAFAYSLKKLWNQWENELSIWFSSAQLWNALVHALTDRGPILSETAWSWLSQETDETRLKWLLLIASLRQDSKLRVFQRAVFEHKTIFDYVLHSMHRSEIMIKVQEVFDTISG